MSDEDCKAFVELDTENVVVCVTHDPPVRNHKKWFPAGSDRGQLFPVTDGNRVDFFTEGAKLFQQMGNDLDLVAAGTNGEVLMANFEFSLDHALGSKTIRQHLAALNAANVQVRALLNQHFEISVPGKTFAFKNSNQPEVDAIDALSTGEAIHDGKLPALGGHHQKLLCLRTSVPDETFVFGYTGGFDPNPPREQASWLDCHCRIDGPAAHDLHNTFVERWNDQASSAKKTPLATTSGSFANDPKRDKTVQIVHTYANLTTDTYGFAPSGVRTLHDLLVNAIDLSKRFIYMEDQYLVSEEISQLLAQRLPILKALVIFVTSSASANASISQANRRRKLFIDRLTAVDAKKVIVCQPKIASHYVHSKCWIFDDELAVIGTANCNRRGYTHDSEVAAAIADENKAGDRLIFAHALRMNLWAKHLDIGVNAVRDPIAAAALWRRPGNTRVQPYDPNAETDGPHKDLGTFALRDAFWDTVIDPDGS